MFNPHGKNPSSDGSLTDALLSVARLAALSLPLVGCRSAWQGPPDLQREGIQSRYDDPLELRNALSPRQGIALEGFEYRNGGLRPLMSPRTQSSSPLNAREIEVAQALLDQDPGYRAITLSKLSLDYLPRLEPVILHLALNDPSSAVSNSAVELLRSRAAASSVETLCAELDTARGRVLNRCVDILAAYPSEQVARAMARAIHTSGYLEKEGRDESMVMGKTLVTLNSLGHTLMCELLQDPEPRMQMAAAVSLASIKNEEALPTLLSYARDSDTSLRAEALSYLPNFAFHPEVIPPLASGLAEQELSQTALQALRQMGPAALPTLLPYTDVAYFLTTGIQRTGNNPFLPGVSYGEIIEAICWCKDHTGTALAINPAEVEATLTAMVPLGMQKLLVDLDLPQLARGALDGLSALGPRAYPYIPSLVSKESARSLLLTYPTSVLLEGCAGFLESDEISIRTLDACSLLGQHIRSGRELAQRQAALTLVAKAYPDSKWVRHLISLCWLEDTDSQWVRAGLQDAEPAPAICELRGELDCAEELGINIPLRWNKANLAEIIRNRSARNFDGRPIATMIYARADFNGAFRQHNSMVEALTKNGYCVMFFDENTDTGVLRAMQRAISRPEEDHTQPAALMILGAHSSRTEMVFGRTGDETTKISLNDKELFLQYHVSDTLRPEAQIILIACSAGEGRETQENIANMFRTIFPHSKSHGIWSSEVPDNIREITFDPQSHEVVNVTFFNHRIYKP